MTAGPNMPQQMQNSSMAPNMMNKAMPSIGNKPDMGQGMGNPMGNMPPNMGGQNVGGQMATSMSSIGGPMPNSNSLPSMSNNTLTNMTNMTGGMQPGGIKQGMQQPGIISSMSGPGGNMSEVVLSNGNMPGMAPQGMVGMRGPSPQGGMMGPRHPGMQGQLAQRMPVSAFSFFSN